jgi:hypothetical protein
MGRHVVIGRRRARWSGPVALLAVLAGCTAPREGPPISERLPANPCALVTSHQVEAATGSAVLDSRRLRADEMMVPGGLRPCAYVTDGRHGTISVYVDSAGAPTFTRQQGGADAVQVPGVGDGAFQEGFASLFVRVGDGFFELNTQKGAGHDGLADLRRLASMALSGLGPT